MAVTVRTSTDPQGPLDFHPKVAATGIVGVLGLILTGIQYATNTWPANHYVKELNVAAALFIVPWMAGYAKTATAAVRQRRTSGPRRARDAELERRDAARAQPTRKR